MTMFTFKRKLTCWGTCEKCPWWLQWPPGPHNWPWSVWDLAVCWHSALLIANQKKGKNNQRQQFGTKTGAYVWIHWSTNILIKWRYACFTQGLTYWWSFICLSAVMWPRIIINKFMCKHEHLPDSVQLRKTLLNHLFLRPKTAYVTEVSWLSYFCDNDPSKTTWTSTAIMIIC